LREFRERRRKERVEGGQKERRERPVSSVSRRAVRVPLSPGSGRRLAVFSPATRKKKLIDLSLRDLQPLFPTSQPRGNRAPSTHSRHATVTSRAKDFGTFTAASHSSLARQEKKEGPLSASPPQKRLLPRRFSQPMPALSSTAFHFSQCQTLEDVTTSPPSGRLWGKKRRDRAVSKGQGGGTAS
jgi:hypothetical protein